MLLFLSFSVCRFCMFVMAAQAFLHTTPSSPFSITTDLFSFPPPSLLSAYSNWGTVVDIYAPGGGIYSASPASRSSYVYMSGTSMATPMVAGGVACVLAGAPGQACTNAALINKLKNPQVTVAQGGAMQQSTRPNRPLFYLPSTADVQCP